ncbi:MAG: signal recognition particle protein [Mycoplasma sp.]
MFFKSAISSIVAKTMGKKLNNSTIQEEDIKEVLKEIRISLLDADVNLLVVKNFINKVKEKSIGQILDKEISPSDFLLNIIKEELIEILGKEQKSINFEKKRTKIMMVGLQGSGKTTTCAKLAYHAQQKYSKKPLLVACDIYRPAAIDQLHQLANDIKSDFYEKGVQSPEKTVKEALDIADSESNDVIIVDTAGRLQTNVELMKELVEVKKSLNPDEIILVVDAMSGQDIINVAKEFDSYLKLTGVIITKLDSDARGGAALSLASILNLPIKFTGVGEKVSGLDLFYPERIADRILGLGDIMTLAEKAVDNIDEKKMRGQFQRMLSGKMDLEDLLSQMEQISNMGSIGGIAGMIPGLQNKISSDKEHEIEQKMKSMKVLMNSMTLKERRNPKIIRRDSNRRNRIIKGSGRKPDELNKLLKTWEDTNKKMTDIGSKMKSGKNPFGAGGGMPF